MLSAPVSQQMQQPSQQQQQQQQQLPPQQQQVVMQQHPQQQQQATAMPGGQVMGEEAPNQVFNQSQFAILRTQIHIYNHLTCILSFQRWESVCPSESSSVAYLVKCALLARPSVTFAFRQHYEEVGHSICRRKTRRRDSHS